MRTYHQQFYYNCGYWVGRNGREGLYYHMPLNPYWWMGLVNGTIDRELNKKGLQTKGVENVD